MAYNYYIWKQTFAHTPSFGCISEGLFRFSSKHKYYFFVKYGKCDGLRGVFYLLGFESKK
jgi:hypothetical protein